MPKAKTEIRNRAAPRGHNHGRRVLYLLFFVLVCGLGVIGVSLLARSTPYTLPEVTILQPSDGAELSAGRTVFILARVDLPEQIVKTELWVDGRLVYVAPARRSQSGNQFAASLPWSAQVGQHTLVVRATDGRGSVGTSNRVRVTVSGEGAFQKQNPAVIQIATAGDTIDSIAEENGVTPDVIRAANPDIKDPPVPGDEVIVHDMDDEPGDKNDDQASGNINDPGAELLPEDLPRVPANPQVEFRAPLFVTTTGLQPPAAPELQVGVANCAAILTWRDLASNETGFYIYRSTPGGAQFTRRATLAANDADALLTYVDENAPGIREYYIAAYNAAGETVSRIVRVEIPAQNCLRPVTAQVLEIEAESLSVRGSPEQIYCYAALKGHRPFERIPTDPNEFINQLRPRVPRADFLLSRWDIADHYAGANKRIVAAPLDGASFRVEVECWGAQMTDEGGEAYSLGSFDRAHPPEEWDGRALTGQADNFDLVYHIRLWSGPGGDANAPIDPDIPPPFNLRRARDFGDCVAHSPADAGSLFGCALVSYPDKAPLVWEWSGVPEQIDGFRIYFNRVPVGGSFIPIEDVGKEFRVWVGPSEIPCDETWRYALAAFDSITESARSEFIALGGKECKDRVLVEVELEQLFMRGDMDDGFQCMTPLVCVPYEPDHWMETYGAAFFATNRAEVNAGPWANVQGVSLAGGGLGERPEGLVGTMGSTFSSGDILFGLQIGEIQFAGLPLCHLGFDDRRVFCADDSARNHNTLHFLVRDGDRISGGVALMDYDQFSGDDLWCDAQFEFGPMTLDEWAQVDQRDEQDGATGYGPCPIRVRVRGLQRVGGSNVLPPTGGGSGQTAKSANLDIVNLERNRSGNLRLTLYNAGPDTLVGDTVTLAFQAARVESGAGGAPGTIWEHDERARVTIPAFEVTTIETGQVLMEGFENRVRVIVTPENFDDPDLRDNTDCARIDIPDAEHVTVAECAGF